MWNHAIKGRTMNEQPAITMSPWDVVTVCESLRREADFWRRAVGRWDVTGQGSPPVGVVGWEDCKRSDTRPRAHMRETVLWKGTRRNLLMTARKTCSIKRIGTCQYCSRENELVKDFYSLPPISIHFTSILELPQALEALNE